MSPAIVTDRTPATVGSGYGRRLSLLQQHLQRVPSLRRRAYSAQGFQPFLSATDFEDVHPPGGAVVERPFQESGAEQQVECPRDLGDVVTDVGGETLTAENDTRMPREEQEQVEVARIPQPKRFNELHGHGVGRLEFLDTVLLPERVEGGTPSTEAPAAHCTPAGRGMGRSSNSPVSDMHLMERRRILIMNDAADVMDVLKPCQWGRVVTHLGGFGRATAA